MKKICVITDNEFIFTEMKKIISDSDYEEYLFEFFYSEINKSFKHKYALNTDFLPVNLKKCDKEFFEQYSLFISLHCKQIFPEIMTDNYRCINIHPGYNPYNRGWFPQVFCILNKKTAGVTIHEIDRDLDHGPIIYQEKIDIESSDTSYDVYKKIQDMEIIMLKKNLLNILEERYTATTMSEEGNVNLKKDFDVLCKIDLNQKATYGEVIDHLRALTFNGYRNAYFLDEDGNKIYVSIGLEKDERE